MLFYHKGVIMKKAIILGAILAATPLLAQRAEASLFVGQQQYPTPQADTTLGTLRMEADNKVFWGLRLGYDFYDMGPALLQGTLSYQPQVSSPIKGSVGGSAFVEIGDFKHEAAALGLMIRFKTEVTLGFGLELRSERLNGTLHSTVGDLVDSTTYTRGWGRVFVGYEIPGPAWKPFVGVDVSYPLSTTSLTVDASNSDALKSLAPKSQFGVYVGMRF